MLVMNVYFRIEVHFDVQNFVRRVLFECNR